MKKSVESTCELRRNMDFPIFLLSGYFFVLFLLFSCVLVYLCCRKFNRDEFLIVEGGNFQPTRITERHCCHQINRKRGCQLTSDASYRKIEFTYSAPLMKLKNHQKISNYAAIKSFNIDWSFRCIYTGLPIKVLARRFPSNILMISL